MDGGSQAGEGEADEDEDARSKSKSRRSTKHVKYIPVTYPVAPTVRRGPHPSMVEYYRQLSLYQKMLEVDPKRRCTLCVTRKKGSSSSASSSSVGTIAPILCSTSTNLTKMDEYIRENVFRMNLTIDLAEGILYTWETHTTAATRAEFPLTLADICHHLEDHMDKILAILLKAIREQEMYIRTIQESTAYQVNVDPPPPSKKPLPKEKDRLHGPHRRHLDDENEEMDEDDLPEEEEPEPEPEIPLPEDNQQNGWARGKQLFVNAADKRLVDQSQKILMCLLSQLKKYQATIQW